MNKRLQIEHLGKLLHLEVHAVSAYDGAIGRTKDDSRRHELEAVRGNHEQHVIDLTELLREMGEAAPAPTPDVDGLFAPSMSALRNASSSDDVAYALRIAEQVVSGEYEGARNWGVGLQVHDVLERLQQDEHGNLEKIGDMVGTGAKGARG